MFRLIGGKHVDLALKNVMLRDSFSLTGSDMLISRKVAPINLRLSRAYLPYFSPLSTICF